MARRTPQGKRRILPTDFDNFVTRPLQTGKGAQTTRRIHEISRSIVVIAIGVGVACSVALGNLVPLHTGRAVQLALIGDRFGFIDVLAEIGIVLLARNSVATGQQRSERYNEAQ